tara:strand:- start:725 stop:1534 length:810 start_codon:yes stop_codon:yes gene_type:complete
MPFIGQQPTTGAFIQLDSLTASATANYTLQLNGANFEPESVNNLLVSINGVIQGSNTMSLSGSTLTVGATLSSSDVIDFVRVFGNVGTISTPTDGSVTVNKLGTGAVTSAKISDGTIVNGDINASAGIDGSKLGTNAIKNVVTSLSRISDSTSNTSYTDTGMSASITPSSTSSKILIMVHLIVQLAGSRTRYTIHSSATNGTLHGASDEGFVALEGNANANRNVAFHHVDSPNTTSSVTYKVQHLNTGGNSTFLVNDNPQEITLLEIGG